MKSYFLLRHNKESGPFTERELKTLPIYETDLIWISGESQSWKNPHEIEELKGFAKPTVKTEPVSNQRKAVAVLNEQTNSRQIDLDLLAAETANNNSLQAYVNAIAEEPDTYHFQPKKQRIRLSMLTANLFGLGVLLFGTMLCAFVVKNLIDQFEYEPAIASSDAIEIKASLPFSYNNSLAKVKELEISSPLVLAATSSVNDSIAGSQIALQKNSIEKKKVATSTLSTEKDNKIEEKLPATKDELIANENSDTETNSPPTEIIPVVKKIPALSLAANDYKVGLFGGISNLEITVRNPSAETVEKATIEVDFLKPNGSVVKTQTITVENLSAGETKQLSVPSSNRGVSIRYRLINSGD